MAKIVRYNGNLVPFASSSLGSERTIFGEVTQADDITSQFTADFLRGWGIVGPSDQPTLQDFNAVSYTHGQILSYIHQVGVAEYDAAQEYYIYSITNESGIVYVSLTNGNIGNAPSSSPANWKALSQPKGLTFISSGSGNYIVPSGVFLIDVEVWGGGGGGGGSGTINTTAGGGGGGGYSRSTIVVVPGQSIAYAVGAAGAAGGAGGAGGTGGTSVFSTMTAAGGVGGSPNPVGNGGTGGVGSGGTINLTGSAGGSGIGTLNGGAGGSSPFGGVGGNSGAGAGGAGIHSGAGGSGRGGSSTGVGALGAAGAIRIQH